MEEISLKTYHPEVCYSCKYIMSLRLRHATLDDVPTMARVGIAAFENDELNLAMFPPSPESPNRFLEERIRFREEMTYKRFKKRGAVSMVVVDDALDGQIVGYAQWEAPTPDSDEAAGNTTEAEEEGAIRSQVAARNQKAVDEFFVASDKEIKRVMGPAGTKDAWCKFRFEHTASNIARRLLCFSLITSCRLGSSDSTPGTSTPRYCEDARVLGYGAGQDSRDEVLLEFNAGWPALLPLHGVGRRWLL